MMMCQTVQYLRDAIEFAPKSPGKLVPDLRGWWTPDGYYVCSPCAGRIIARGCNLPRDSEPVWRDKPEPFGVCVCCEAVCPICGGEEFVAPLPGTVGLRCVRCCDIEPAKSAG